MPKIRLLIASAHVIVRTVIGTLLKGVWDFDVVGRGGPASPCQISGATLPRCLSRRANRGRNSWTKARHLDEECQAASA